MPTIEKGDILATSIEEAREALISRKMWRKEFTAKEA